MDAVMSIGPDFFVMENVPGLASSGISPEFSEYMRRLAKAIGEPATVIVDALPQIPSAVAKRDRQFRKRLVSEVVSAAKLAVTRIVESSAQKALAAAIEEARRELRERLEERITEAYRRKLSFPQEVMEESTVLSVAMVLEAAMDCGIVEDVDCEEALKEVVCRTKGEVCSVATRILNQYDSAPKATIFKGKVVGPVLAHLIQRASTMYEISAPEVLSAAWFGAPQDRRRLFLVGLHRRLGGKFLFPDRQFDLPGTMGIKDLLQLQFAPTCKEVIADLPNVDRYPALLEDDKLSAKELKPTRCRLARLLRLEEIEPDDESIPRPDWNPYVVDCCLRTVHADYVVERLRATEHGVQDDTSHRTRLHPDKVSHTIRAGTREGKGSHTAVRPIHYEFDRVITVREAARLMAYPDWMTFHRTKWHGFRLVGNGVPVPLGRAIARSIRAAISSCPNREESSEARECILPSLATEVSA
jgi:site-specific DNA-cytosine methylase